MIVKSKDGRYSFRICDRCEHWTARREPRLLDKCKCCHDGHPAVSP